MRSVVCLALMLGLLSSVFTFAQAPANLEARRKALNDLLKEQWEYSMRTSPIYASVLGDKRYNDQLGDYSQKAIEEDLAQTKKFLERFEAIDTTGFPEQESLNKTLMVRDLKDNLVGAKFKPWEMPVTQFGGLHIQLPQLVSVLAFTNVKDYEDYIARLKQVPRVFDETTIQMRKGMAEGLMPPRMLLEKVVTQSDKLASQKAEESPFAQPFKKFPEGITEADQKRLRDAGLAAIQDSVLPTYVKFTKFVKDEYAPKGRTEPGVWALPDGAERYAYLVRQNTTTTLSPEEIHQIGLQQVQEIEARMLKVANQLGYKDLKSFNAAIQKDPKLHFRSRQEIIDLYKKDTDQMYTKLPNLFGRLPKAKVEIMPIEEFREKESATHYIQPALDGSRPGHVMVNTSDFQNRTMLSVETTAYHEGVPGHHMQIAIAQELPQLPPFRQNEYYNAYTEGWALYSERLGEEVGFFQDPYSYYGHLQDDMLRAIRLVVDTGFHYKRWTRQQVVDFFHQHSTIDEPEVQSETDRYIAIPGQALGYKIGQLEILKLREYAKNQLGSKFDLRAFHDELLGAGALPMDVLSDRVHAWVGSEKASAGGSTGTVAH
ncbi:MAG TPA: DUF885 family protein [Terriglobales bacterium]|jgi:uncharacterized protein (DUF885 family)|nr:DUF885 family protein [Terriglobales bacterium]